GIAHNIKTNKQRYFPNHVEDIVSLGIHPNKHTVATGQMAAKGEAKQIDLYVWDVNNLPEETNVNVETRREITEGVTNLKGALLRAIRITKFSPDGNYLIANGQDDDNSVALYNSKNLKKITFITKEKVDKERVLDLAWSSNTEFVTVGPGHIKFFKISGNTLTGKKGNLGKYKSEPLACVASAFGKIFTGTNKGNIVPWTGQTPGTAKNICKKGAVFVLNYYDKEKLLLAGAADGIITAFDSAKLAPKFTLDVQKITKTPTDPAIRSIDLNDNGDMLIGTKGGEIVEINMETKTMKRSIMKSHYLDELWGLTINPSNGNLVATGGGDSTLRIWDIKKNKQVGFLKVPVDFRAIDWSTDGSFIIIATTNGVIYYVDVKTMELSPPYNSLFYSPQKAKKKKENEPSYDSWIQELKISPDMEYCAYGSHCAKGKAFGRVEVLKISKNVKKPFTLYKQVNANITSAVTHLDWSTDNERIVVNSLAFELKYLSINQKNSITSSTCVWTPDLWHTWTCLFGYPVQGIYPPASTGYVVNYSCVSDSKKVVATGDDFSLVKLFKCPSVIEHAEYNAYGGHSSHIPKVRFTPGDKYLISVGGNDKSVFVWQTDWGSGNEEEGEEGGNEEEDQGGNGNEDDDLLPEEREEYERLNKASKKEKSIKKSKAKEPEEDDEEEAQYEEEAEPENEGEEEEGAFSPDDPSATYFKEEE
ncbi:MAG: WD40 repeat domain-containing protein, partial [archaeon]|nr:WD40 repeat domain-containing protein [archaeon]